MKIGKCLCGILMSLALSACESTPAWEIDNQSSNTIKGTLIGIELESVIDSRDMALLDNKTSEALTHVLNQQSLDWKNPETGNHGVITIIMTYYVSNTICKEFRQSYVTENSSYLSHSKACAEPDNATGGVKWIGFDL